MVKKIEEIGGRRLIAQRLRGVTLSTKYQGGGNPDYPHQSTLLYDDLEIYNDVWGEKSMWTKEAIQRARQSYLNGRRPWFCQVCGCRACSECGAPINLPVGSDVLYENGCSSHCAILPVAPWMLQP